jgi:type VI protein secretion system component Hcp
MIDGVRTGDDPAESISMTYGKIEFDYTQLKSDGSSGGSSMRGGT